MYTFDAGHTAFIDAHELCDRKLSIPDWDSHGIISEFKGILATRDQGLSYSRPSS